MATVISWEGANFGDSPACKPGDRPRVIIIVYAEGVQMDGLCASVLSSLSLTPSLTICPFRSLG